MIMTDISATMSWMVQRFVEGFQNIFGWLASFEFAGTNLLTVMITITVLGVFLPTLLTIPSNMAVSEKRKARRSKKDDK